MVATRLDDVLAAAEVPSGASGQQPGWSALILSTDQGHLIEAGRFQLNAASSQATTEARRARLVADRS
jgi:hypothetical protein